MSSQTEQTVKTYRVVTKCVVEGCPCNVRNGIVLYEGSDKDEADRRAEVKPVGYETTIDTIPSPVRPLELRGP